MVEDISEDGASAEGASGKRRPQTLPAVEKGISRRSTLGDVRRIYKQLSVLCMRDQRCLMENLVRLVFGVEACVIGSVELLTKQTTEDAMALLELRGKLERRLGVLIKDQGIGYARGLLRDLIPLIFGGSATVSDLSGF